MVEGAKNVNELLSAHYEIAKLYVTEKYLSEFPQAMISKYNYEICKEGQLADMGTFLTNEYALAIAKMQVRSIDLLDSKLTIALDDVSDPGNLGTIIRIADWYGIKNILASPNSADFYNPKVINASMGSFTRVNVTYMDLEKFFISNKSHGVYGAILNGENIHNVKFDNPAILLMGNESNGISPSLFTYLDNRITIPGFGNAESLNVAVSTAIICDNYFRN